LYPTFRTQRAENTSEKPNAWSRAVAIVTARERGVSRS
jgi:hypothetical protein